MSGSEKSRNNVTFISWNPKVSHFNETVTYVASFYVTDHCIFCSYGNFTVVACLTAACHWLHLTVRQERGGTMNVLRWSDRGWKKRESFQDGGAELPVGWKTIEAASLSHRPAPFSRRSHQILGPFASSVVAPRTAVTRGELSCPPLWRIDFSGVMFLLKRLGLAAQLV